MTDWHKINISSFNSRIQSKVHLRKYLEINSEESKIDIVNFLDILGALHANIINL